MFFRSTTAVPGRLNLSNEFMVKIYEIPRGLKGINGFKSLSVKGEQSDLRKQWNIDYPQGVEQPVDMRPNEIPLGYAQETN